MNSEAIEHTRKIYIPAKARKFVCVGADATAYAYEDAKGRPCVITFIGRARKPSGRYYFRSEQSREAHVKRVFDSARERAKYKADRAAEKKAFVNPYKIGDLFCSSWGYDQTNIDYFEVVAVSGSMMTVRELKQSTAETGWMTGRCVPLPGQYRGEPKRVRAQKGGFKSPIYGWASFEEPKVVAGVKTYDSSSYSSYA
jgi:hypothetical protein